MYAVLVSMSIPPEREEESIVFLRENVLPVIRQTPGIVGGYWLKRPDGSDGVALTIFESEDAARASMEGMNNAPRPDYVTFTGADLLEVVDSL